MPPHDMDCSGFVWAVVDDDGNISQEYHGIPSAKEIADSYFIPQIAMFDPGSAEISMKLHIRNRRGLMDVLCNLNTKAAGRYIRNSKRWKEKQRRDRLKGKV